VFVFTIVVVVSSLATVCEDNSWFSVSVYLWRFSLVA